MYNEYLKHLISFIVAPTEAIFITSSLAFELHDDIIFMLDTCSGRNCSSKVNANIP